MPIQRVLNIKNCKIIFYDEEIENNEEFWHLWSVMCKYGDIKERKKRAMQVSKGAGSLSRTMTIPHKCKQNVAWNEGRGLQALELRYIVV